MGLELSTKISMPLISVRRPFSLQDGQTQVVRDAEFATDTLSMQFAYTIKEVTGVQIARSGAAYTSS